jgi:molybdopterin-guanine dinucleotide biosynthesis protein A
LDGRRVLDQNCVTGRTRVTRLPALLLTGGSSRRLGTDKATIVWQGDTLAARAARVLTRVCAPVIEVGPGVTALPVARERPPGAGPLAAVLAGVRAIESHAGSEVDAVLVLACDMPFVEPPLLELLATWPGTGTVIPTRDGRAQYLCARYGKAWLRNAEAAGTTSFKAVPALECELIAEDAWHAISPANAFDDIDTPADRARSIGQ